MANTQRERCPRCRSTSKAVLRYVFIKSLDCEITCPDPWHVTPAAPEPPQDALELQFRQELWLQHGHFAALYGDDGEMQCAHRDCRWDFKRADMQATIDHVKAIRILRTRSTPSPGQKGICDSGYDEHITPHARLESCKSWRVPDSPPQIVSAPEFKLCYVSDQRAFFTTQKLEDQWGDDWNDAPYEHNAETPYEPHPPQDFIDGQPKWEILEVRFDGWFEAPCEGHNNSPWNVQQINQGSVYWLKAGKGETIMAGASPDQFKDFVRRNGGSIWLPEKYASSSNAALQDESLNHQRTALESLDLLRAAESKVAGLQQELKTAGDYQFLYFEATKCIAKGSEEIAKLRDAGDGLREALREISNMPNLMGVKGLKEAARAALGTESTEKG